MNPTSGSDILGYTGKVALGLNTEGLSSFGDTDTSLINEAVQRASLINLQKNNALYEQKQKEKNDTFALIASGKLNIPQVRPENRQDLLDSVDEVKKILLDNRGDVQSNIETWTKFNDALTRFDEKKKYATSRLLELEKQQAEIAATQRPDLKRKMIENYEQNVKKGLFDDLTPYQQQQDWTVDDLVVGGGFRTSPNYGVARAQADANGDIVTTGGGAIANTGGGSTTGKAKDQFDPSQLYTTTVSDANDKYERTTTKKINYERLVTAANDTYLKDDGTGSYYRTTDGFNGLFGSPQGTTAVIETNKAIDKLNVTRIKDGLRPVEHLGVMLDNRGNPIVGQDGHVMFTDDLPTVKAKYSLTHLQPVVSSTEVDLDAARAARLKTQMDSDRALASQRRSVIPLNKAKTKYWNDKLTETENSRKVENIYYKDIIPRTKEITIDHYKPGTSEITSTERRKVILASDLPPGFAQLLGGLDGSGKPLKLEPKTTSNGREYYDVVESGFITRPDGVRYSQSAIDDAFSNQSDYKTRTEFMRHFLRPESSGGLGFTRETEVEGSNGRGTAQTTIQSLRALSNKSVSNKSDEPLTQEED